MLRKGPGLRFTVDYTRSASGTAYVEVYGALDEEHARDVLEEFRDGPAIRGRSEETMNTVLNGVSRTGAEDQDILHTALEVTPARAEKERIRRLEAAGQQRLEGM